jgi:endonuclease YncB( thermonuclease family)
MFSLFNNFIICSCKKNSAQESLSFDLYNVKPFIPPIVGGIVIKVYDGDTITIVSKLPYEKSELYIFSVRLKDINAPEIKSKHEDEKTIAKEAQVNLSNLLLYKHVSLKNLHTEKYGRILADVYLQDNTHVNKWILEHRFAVEYNGGTKNSPSSWIKYRLTGEI